jgi:uncharacterized repeat protein (TIGR03803 family)
MRHQKFSPTLVASLIFVTISAATITQAAAAAPLRTPITFNGPNGASPYAGLIFDRAGNLYGTTPNGGAYGYGAVFELSHTGSDWAETILYSFCTYNCLDGSSPEAALLLDSEGNLYGTTESGGAYSSGTVFKLSKAPDGTWGEKVLYSFCASANCADGSFPITPLILGAGGQLYGTTLEGGQGACLGSGIGCGVVFELSSASNGQWNETVLHTFTGGDDGGSPVGGLVSDSSGNLYGDTWLGGAKLSGVVYELTNVVGVWSETVLHYFCEEESCVDGAYPKVAPIFGSDGALYGTTDGGGTRSSSNATGYGVVFQLTFNGSVWTENVLWAFDGTDGNEPFGGVVFDSNGNLYGATVSGGAQGLGTLFELEPAPGNQWSESILHNFSGHDDGSEPYGTLAIDAAGNLFGTTEHGGAAGLGTVFGLKRGASE